MGQSTKPWKFGAPINKPAADKGYVNCWIEKAAIDKIQNKENKSPFEEPYRLLQPEMEDIEIHKLNADQKNSINQGRQQIKDGQFLRDTQANKEIDEWLNK